MDKAKKKQLKKAVTWGLLAALVTGLAAMPLLAKEKAEADGPVASVLSGTVETGSITTVLHGGGTLSSEDVEDIPLRERAGEYLMMRLRTSAGIIREEYERQYLLPFGPIEEALEKCRTFGHAAQGDDGRWRLTPKGFLISNSIISDLLLIQDGTEQMNRFSI